jgi:hypothetical protein
MFHAYPPDTYPASSYDDYMCLKPPLLLWLAVVYLSRALTLPLIVGMGHVAGVSPEALSALRGLWAADTLVPSLIAAVLVVVFFRRVPGASPVMRWIWAHGVIFVAVSAVVDCGLSLIPLIRAQEITDQTLISSLGGAVDIYFLLYVSLARRVRDTFAEFPPPEALKG